MQEKDDGTLIVMDFRGDKGGKKMTSLGKWQMIPGFLVLSYWIDAFDTLKWKIWASPVDQW